MLAGELLMDASTSWSVQIAGRLIAGTGGILLSVLMTKMVADWFTGREIATATAVFVNSWPVGIAISLMLLPLIAARSGLHAINLAVAGWILIGLGLMAFVYRAPEGAVSVEGDRGSLTSETVYTVIAASSIWCLYNIAFAMIFSFGPSMLVERGWSIAAAGSTISIVLWRAALSVPFGGFLADQTKRGEAIIVAGCIAFALLTVLLSRSGPVLPVVIAVGIVCGLPAGASMSLPARVLEPKTRAIGMGYSIRLSMPAARLDRRSAESFPRRSAPRAPRSTSAPSCSSFARSFCGSSAVSLLAGIGRPFDRHKRTRKSNGA